MEKFLVPYKLDREDEKFQKEENDMVQPYFREWQNLHKKYDTVQKRMLKLGPFTVSDTASNGVTFRACQEFGFMNLHMARKFTELTRNDGLLVFSQTDYIQNGVNLGKHAFPPKAPLPYMMEHNPLRYRVYYLSDFGRVIDMIPTVFKKVSDPTSPTGHWYVIMDYLNNDDLLAAQSRRNFKSDEISVWVFQTNPNSSTDNFFFNLNRRLKEVFQEAESTMKNTKIAKVEKLVTTASTVAEATPLQINAAIPENTKKAVVEAVVAAVETPGAIEHILATPPKTIDEKKTHEIVKNIVAEVATNPQSQQAVTKVALSVASAPNSVKEIVVDNVAKMSRAASEKVVVVLQSAQAVEAVIKSVPQNTEQQILKQAIVDIATSTSWLSSPKSYLNTTRRGRTIRRRSPYRRKIRSRSASYSTSRSRSRSSSRSRSRSSSYSRSRSRPRSRKSYSRKRKY